MAYSIFDSLNRLPDIATLEHCFKSVFASCTGGAEFLFDMLTVRGLAELTTYTLHHLDGGSLSTNLVFDDSLRRAYIRTDGLKPTRNGLFERFTNIHIETGFPISEILKGLSNAGWNRIRVVRPDNFELTLESPERATRVVFLCSKEGPS